MEAVNQVDKVKFDHESGFYWQELCEHSGACNN